MISFGYWANTRTVVDLGTLKSEQQLKAAPFIGDDKQCRGKSEFSAKNVSTNMAANISLFLVCYLIFFVSALWKSQHQRYCEQRR